jgi:hypothetical protein
MIGACVGGESGAEIRLKAGTAGARAPKRIVGSRTKPPRPDPWPAPRARLGVDPTMQVTVRVGSPARIEGDKAPAVSREKEGSMTNQDDEDKKNMRIMWIASGVIALFIVGLMFTIGAPTQTTRPATDMSSQSRTAPRAN